MKIVDSMDSKDEILKKVEERRKDNHIRRKNRIFKQILMAIIFIIIVITAVILKFLTSVQGIIFKDGKKEYYNNFINWITNYKYVNVIEAKITNLVVKSSERIKGELDIKKTMIFTFDENNKCIGTRVYMEGFSDEELYRRYTSRRDAEPALTNMRIENKNLIYSYNQWIGEEKKDIKKLFEGNEYYKTYEY